jgi:flagellar hook assembly protein FlgD
VHLEGNHPNPFNPATVIAWTLPAPGKVLLEVYDLSGGLVRVLENGTMGEGRHTTTWDGRDEAGHAVPSGVYLYALEGEDFRESRKMVLIR